MVSFFTVLIFFSVTAQIAERVKFSAFAMLYVICICLLPLKWLYKMFLSLEPAQSPCLQLQLFLLRAYIAVHKFDVICLSKILM